MTSANPSRNLLHLTDSHVVAEGELLHGSVDSLDNLRRILDAAEASGTATDAILLTGDLTDTGVPEAYRRLRAVVEPVAARMGAQVVWAMGNHDERSAFSSELLDDPDAGQRSVDSVTMVGGLRILVLDSTVPGHHHGRIDEEQYTWLADQLAEPAPEGTVVVVHHPPVPAEGEMALAVGFHDAQRFTDAIAGTDVRVVLAGHTHAPAASVLGSAFLWVGGAVAYAFDGTAPAGTLRGRPAPSFSRIDLRGPRTGAGSIVTASSVPLPPVGEPPVYEVTAEQMAAAILAHSAAPATAS
ncbi:metallophosphoesterase [Nakamurella leprariae]|uniref:Metallophosphoesterase n=1 Tax=Nakamurella leprariae TaxID=2803911 RepID=A0A938YAF2_9ACTN|nr:metallophosphoesterase [Nakamurella leprariae]MBM9468870.1 metallophosphoesterase [Nakamurella leprariae]